MLNNRGEEVTTSIDIHHDDLVGLLRLVEVVLMLAD